MIQISADQVTTEFRALFRKEDMQARRCFAVLEGQPPQGKIWVERLHDPRWAVVQEAGDHCTFLGGQMDEAAAQAVFAALRAEGEVLVGLALDDPRLALLPPDPHYDGRVLEMYDRPLGAGLDQLLDHIPADCELRRMDRDLVMRSEWGPGDVAVMGGLEGWGRSCLGFCLMRGDEILSEASVGPPELGLYEPGVFTHPAQRGKGYGTLVTARLIQEIEARGGQTYWNCDKKNLSSAAIARKLGYRVEKEFRCMAWGKTG